MTYIAKTGTVWTQQKAFDAVVMHLATTRKPCKEDGNCAYRGPGTSRCAVGALIPNDEFKTLPREDRYGGVNDNVMALPCFKKIDKTARGRSLLDELQTAHDEDFNWHRTAGGIVSGFRQWSDLEAIRIEYKLKPNATLKAKLKEQSNA